MTDLYLIRYHADDKPAAVATVPSFVHPSYRELYDLGFRPCSKAVYTEAKQKLAQPIATSA